MGEPGERRGSRLLRWLGIAFMVYLVPALVLLLDGAFFSFRPRLLDLIAAH